MIRGSLFVFILGISFFIQAQTISERLEKSQAAFNNSQWDECIRVTSIILEQKPKDISARMLRGESLMIKKKWNQALIDFAVVQELNPEIAETYVKIAIIHFQNKAYTACIDQLLLFKKLPPTDTKQILYKMNEYGVAEIATTVNMDADIDDMLGQAHYQLKSYSLAEYYYLEAIAKKPKATFYSNLALNYFEKRDTVQARFFFEKAQKMDENNEIIYQNGVAMGFLTRKDTVVTVSQHIYAGVEYFMDKKYDQAIIYFQKAIKLDSTQSLAWINLGKTYAKLQYWELAKQAYAKVLLTETQLWEVHYLLGDVAFHEMAFTEAKTHYQTYLLMEKQPQPSVYYNYALTLFQLDEKKAACQNAMQSELLGFEQAAAWIKKYCME